jgi:hypothetical protein
MNKALFAFSGVIGRGDYAKNSIYFFLMIMGSVGLSFASFLAFRSIASAMIILPIVLFLGVMHFGLAIRRIRWICGPSKEGLFWAMVIGQFIPIVNLVIVIMLFFFGTFDEGADYVTELGGTSDFSLGAILGVLATHVLFTCIMIGVVMHFIPQGMRVAVLHKEIKANEGKFTKAEQDLSVEQKMSVDLAIKQIGEDTKNFIFDSEKAETETKLYTLLNYYVADGSLSEKEAKDWLYLFQMREQLDLEKLDDLLKKQKDASKSANIDNKI